VSPGERKEARWRRFYWNLWLFGLPAWVRDLWTVGLTIMLVVVLHGQQSAIDTQRQGRKVAVEVTCGALTGVIDAGRATLVAPVQPPRLRHELERLGLPKGRAGRRLRAQAATAYSRFVALRVEQASGVRGLVTKDGRLDCRKLTAVSRARP
jgi:hypothetical protein